MALARISSLIRFVSSVGHGAGGPTLSFRRTQSTDDALVEVPPQALMNTSESMHAPIETLKKWLSPSVQKSPVAHFNNIVQKPPHAPSALFTSSDAAKSGLLFVSSTYEGHTIQGDKITKEFISLGFHGNGKCVSAAHNISPTVSYVDFLGKWDWVAADQNGVPIHGTYDPTPHPPLNLTGVSVLDGLGKQPLISVLVGQLGAVTTVFDEEDIVVIDMDPVASSSAVDIGAYIAATDVTDKDDRKFIDETEGVCVVSYRLTDKAQSLNMKTKKFEDVDSAILNKIFGPEYKSLIVPVPPFRSFCTPELLQDYPDLFELRASDKISELSKDGRRVKLLVNSLKGCSGSPVIFGDGRIRAVNVGGGMQGNEGGVISAAVFAAIMK